VQACTGILSTMSSRNAKSDIESTDLAINILKYNEIEYGNGPEPARRRIRATPFLGTAIPCERDHSIGREEIK
jgi:hypothetical protein